MIGVDTFMIIGLGTGRCGTVSLSRLLQKVGLNVTHELAPFVSWGDGRAKDRLDLLKSSKLDGDVAFWYLNLVEDMNEICENIRFVCLRRNIDETVHSYMIKTVGRNHWVNHSGSNWFKDNIWDQCYPKYDIDDKSKACRLYCEEYHSRSIKLQESMDNFKIFNVNCLNSKSGVQSIFDFLGINLKVSEDFVDIRWNQSDEN